MVVPQTGRVSILSLLFSDRDLHFILHLNDRKSRWNVRAPTMVSAVGGLALAARAAWQARRNIWGLLGFVPTNFRQKTSSHNYYFLEKKIFLMKHFLWQCLKQLVPTSSITIPPGLWACTGMQLSCVGGEKATLLAKKWSFIYHQPTRAIVRAH